MVCSLPLSLVASDADCFRAPSYFSKFFEDQLRNNNNGDTGVKPLYIDRDPLTFQDIACHLQGDKIKLSRRRSY